MISPNTLVWDFFEKNQMLFESFKFCVSKCNMKKIWMLYGWSNHGRGFENWQIAKLWNKAWIHQDFFTPITLRQNGVVEGRREHFRRWIMLYCTLISFISLFGQKLFIQHVISKTKLFLDQKPQALFLETLWMQPSLYLIYNAIMNLSCEDV